jgi:hypothetical protein
MAWLLCNFVVTVAVGPGVRSETNGQRGTDCADAWNPGGKRPVRHVGRQVNLIVTYHTKHYKHILRNNGNTKVYYVGIKLRKKK